MCFKVLKFVKKLIQIRNEENESHLFDIALKMDPSHLIHNCLQ